MSHELYDPLSRNPLIVQDVTRNPESLHSTMRPVQTVVCAVIPHAHRSRSFPRWRGPAAAIALIASLTGTGGCVSGSLASSTDLHPAGYRLSDRPHQMVHVGETVEFDFVLQDASRRLVPPIGLADYCAAQIGSERIEVEPDLTGHFRFTHRFDGVQAGDKVYVQATAFRQRGRRDFMKVHGRWLTSESGLDTPDRAVGRDAISLVVYERPIELRLVHPADTLDPDSGVLRIHRADGTITVYADRPHRPGFTMTGRQPDGYVYIRYRPGGDELSAVGTTEVEFEVYDVAGQRHRVSAALDTP